jgi:hypothetical protein
VFRWQAYRRIIATSACINGTQIIPLATLILSLIPLAPVSAQVSVARSRIVEKSKSGHRCDGHADCSGLAINKTRALFRMMRMADTADSEFTSRKFVTVNIALASQRYLLALTGEALGTSGSPKHTDISLNFGSLTLNMDSDNAFPEHDPMASADLVLSVHRKF